MKILVKWPRPHKGPRRRKIWKLKKPSVSKEFEQLFSETIPESNNGEHNLDNTCHNIEKGLLKPADNICGCNKRWNQKAAGIMMLGANLRFYCLAYIIITTDTLWQNYR